MSRDVVSGENVVSSESVVLRESVVPRENVVLSELTVSVDGACPRVSRVIVHPKMSDLLSVSCAEAVVQ